MAEPGLGWDKTLSSAAGGTAAAEVQHIYEYIYTQGSTAPSCNILEANQLEKDQHTGSALHLHMGKHHADMVLLLFSE